MDALAYTEKCHRKRHFNTVYTVLYVKQKVHYFWNLCPVTP